MKPPEGFVARPLLPSDLDDVFEVCEAYDIEMLGESGMEKADIEGLWKMPNFHLNTDSVGVFDGSRLMAYAEVFLSKYVESCVHADYRGRGLGTVLAQWSEGRLRDMGAAKAIQSAPVTDEAVYEVVQAAFGEWPERDRTPYEDWRAVVFDRKGFRRDNLLVAAKGDEIVGVCFVIDGERSGWIQNVAVDKAHRNRGIAQVLLARAFEGTRSRGLKRGLCLLITNVCPRRRTTCAPGMFLSERIELRTLSPEE